MYSTLAIHTNSKRTGGKLIGTHQRLDKIARRQFGKHLVRLEHQTGHASHFPTSKEILYFEGMRGPDGLKRKSPGVDEPMHFIIPDHDDGRLIRIILNHQYNLHHALQKANHVRAAFEAAWLAHAITDGLTPAHHFPLQEAQEELMSDKEFVKIFGSPIKGIMRGEDLLETARNNWLYWGSDGYMSKHIAFEYGIAITTAAMPDRALTPTLQPQDFQAVDLQCEFYRSLHKIASLDMYNRFRHGGWTTELAFESKNILLPEIIRCIILGWTASL